VPQQRGLKAAVPPSSAKQAQRRSTDLPCPFPPPHLRQHQRYGSSTAQQVTGLVHLETNPLFGQGGFQPDLSLGRSYHTASEVWELPGESCSRKSQPAAWVTDRLNLRWKRWRMLNQNRGWRILCNSFASLRAGITVAMAQRMDGNMLSNCTLHL